MELHTVVVNGGQLFRNFLEGNDAKNSQMNSMISAQILIQTHVINGLSGGRAVPGVPCFSWLAAFRHSDDGNYTVEAPQKSKQMKGMLEERHARGVCVLWTSVTARGCCPSGWYSWTMRLKKFGTQPWQSAYDV